MADSILFHERLELDTRELRSVVSHQGLRKAVGSKHVAQMIYGDTGISSCNGFHF